MSRGFFDQCRLLAQHFLVGQGLGSGIAFLVEASSHMLKGLKGSVAMLNVETFREAALAQVIVFGTPAPIPVGIVVPCFEMLAAKHHAAAEECFSTGIHEAIAAGRDGTVL